MTVVFAHGDVGARKDYFPGMLDDYGVDDAFALFGFAYEGVGLAQEYFSGRGVDVAALENQSVCRVGIASA